ncbi:MAG: Coq4 family protein [Myxococcota bacterium]|nr:Coq4 family protein [Myxococcota bacterium]
MRGRADSSVPGASFRPGRVRPWIALRAFARAWRNLEDTEAGARFVYALQGRTPERIFQRFRSHPDGARLLAEARPIREILEDRERLRGLPEGSLGRAYLEFMEEEAISNEGLVDATADPALEILGPMDPERRYVHDRITDTHDLWHVATGYSRDLIGEFALMAFGYEQLGNPAYRLFLALSRLYWALQVPGSRALIDGARLRGRSASWLPVADWEGLLSEPLEGVRERLGLGPAPHYTRHFRVDGRLRPEAPPLEGRPASASG